MTRIVYDPACTKLISQHGNFAFNLLSPTGSIELDVSHCLFGILGEDLELIYTANEEEDEFEEIGDVMFYLNALGRVLEIDDIEVSEYVNDHSKHAPYGEFSMALLEFIDLYKKVVFYKQKPFKVELFETLYFDLFHSFYKEYLNLNTLHFFGGGIVRDMSSITTRIILKNMEKLKKRYGDKFSTSASIQRADKDTQ